MNSKPSADPKTPNPEVLSKVGDQLARVLDGLRQEQASLTGFRGSWLNPKP